MIDGVLQRCMATPDHEDFGPGNVGDCTRAAMATILGLRLEEVPHFADYPEGYSFDEDPIGDERGALYARVARRWLRAEWERDLALYDDPSIPLEHIDAHDRDVWPRYLLGSIDSPRGDFQHDVVVDRHGEIVWDPSPAQNAYGRELKWLGLICAPYDPPPPDPDPWAEEMLVAHRDSLVKEPV